MCRWCVWLGVALPSRAFVCDHLAVYFVRPQHAYLPTPKVMFDSLLAFGKVVLDNSSALFLELRNEGMREAAWSIQCDEDAPLRIEPAKGALACILLPHITEGVCHCCYCPVLPTLCRRAGPQRQVH